MPATEDEEIARSTYEVGFALFVRGHDLLGLTQVDLAKVLDVSKRTVGRWYASRSGPGAHPLATMARLVQAQDAALAAKLVEVPNEQRAIAGLAAFRKARELWLTLDDVELALTPEPQKSKR